jgi:hypothetical protein
MNLVMDKILLFEDFTKLYGRWSSGTKRKEDGSEVETPYGTMLLKDRSCDYEKLIHGFLDYQEDMEVAFELSQYMGVSKEEIKNIENYKTPYVYPLEDLRRGGLCIEFLPYDDALNDYCIHSDDYCEADYMEICKCLAKYLRDNVEIGSVKGKSFEYRLLLYSGDLPDEFNFDEFQQDFEIEFDVEIETWSYYMETNIGVEINYANVKSFKEMKDYILNYVKNYEEYIDA